MGETNHFLARFEERTELIATFNIALLGCTAVFASLQNEIKSIAKDLTEDGRPGTSSKIKIYWKEDAMQEMLRQLRNQQVAVSLLIEILQIFV